MSVRTQAFVNFYAAIGTLEKFVEMDAQAAEIAKAQDISIRFNVNNGPDGLLIFKSGKVSVIPNDGRKTNIHLYMKSPEAFNAVVDGKGMPIPLKGLLKTLKFMGNKTSPFSKLTDDMTSVMRNAVHLDGSEADEMSIILSFYAMVAALAEIGNNDDLGRISAKHIPDGEISLEIKDRASATIIKKDGKLTCLRKKAENPRAFMIFDSMETAGALIRGTVDAMACLSSGSLIMKGYIPMLEHLNKILNLVPKYLA